MCAANPTHLRRKSHTFAPQIPHICAADGHICAADSPHLRRRFATFAPHIRHICAASMCDLRRLHVRSAWRSRRSSRAAAAGARCRAAARLWRAAAAVGSAPADAAREPGHPQMVAGQAAGKLPYATTWWLLDAVARHATAASSDFFCVPFGGRANGRVCQQYLQRPQRPREPCTVRLRRRLLRALPLPAARAAAARRTLAGCVCAAGCRTPHARPGSSVRCVCAAGCWPATRATHCHGSACRCRPPHTLLAACAPQAVARLTPA